MSHNQTINSPYFPHSITFTEGDPLDLFDTQKTACRKLIHYLERLVNSVPQEASLSQNSAPRQDANGVDDDEDGDSTDSAEDLPHSFQQIGLHSQQQQRPISPRQQAQGKTASKGRSVVKRAAKKQAMVSAQ